MFIRYHGESSCFFARLNSTLHINLYVRLIDSWFNFTLDQVIRLSAMTLTGRRIVSYSVDAFQYV